MPRFFLPCRQCFFALFRKAGVIVTRCRLFGANTPWKRVRLTLGLGTSASKRTIKSSGSRSHEWCRHECFELVAYLAVNRYCQPFFLYPRANNITAQPFEFRPTLCIAHNTCMETEACHICDTTWRKPLLCHRCNGLQGKDLSSLLFACSDAISNIGSSSSPSKARYSWWKSSQRTRKTPYSKRPHLMYASNSDRTYLGKYLSFCPMWFRNCG